VDCAAHDGYHLREADLYFEIVSPANGAPAGPGEYGEVVFTTLTRRGMPLIRYRTGDISRLLPGRCACGSLVQRLERVRHRTDGQISLGPYGELCMAELDEALFAVPGVTGFTAALDSGIPATFRVDVCAPHGHGACLRFDVKQALRAVPAIQRARAAAALEVMVQVSVSPAEPAGGKRRIQRWAA
jgi:phenylacetate-coenzyme A ligase PaaK-like adenylate-forming protein